MSCTQFLLNCLCRFCWITEGSMGAFWCTLKNRVLQFGKLFLLSVASTFSGTESRYGRYLTHLHFSAFSFFSLSSLYVAQSSLGPPRTSPVVYIDHLFYICAFRRLKHWAVNMQVYSVSLVTRSRAKATKVRNSCERER